MNKQSQASTASLSGTIGDDMTELCAAFRCRDDAITLARQFIQLIRAVQRHRGTSMALLAGDNTYLGEFETLDLELERRLAFVTCFASKNGLLSAREYENLHNAWMTLCGDWQDDDVIDNFELHSYVLEQILDMLTTLAKQLGKPIALPLDHRQADLTKLVAEGVSPTSHVFRQRELLEFVTFQVPQMVEQVARIRGLSTYAISCSSCSQQIALKLRFSVGRVREQVESLRRCIDRFSSSPAGAVFGLSQLRAYEMKLMFLLNQVETEVLRRKSIATASRPMYTLATEIIDAYLRVVDDGISMVGRWHHEHLDMWLSGSMR